MVLWAGLIVVGFGLVSAIWPYKVARFGEQVDAIGSKRRWSEVEPADWNVELTRILGIAFAFIGSIVTLGG